jgi:hypothetical protein
LFVSFPEAIQLDDTMLPACDLGEASAVPGIARKALIGSLASREPSHCLTDGITLAAFLDDWLAGDPIG